MVVSRPKRLLFVHSSDELYGADVVLCQLVSSLDRRKFEPIVVLPSDVAYYKRALSAELAKLGITHYAVKMGVIRRRYFNPSGLVRYAMYLGFGARKLACLVRRHHVDLVHSNTSAVLGGALVARVFGLPHVWHVHEILDDPAWLGRLIYRIILANSTRVVAISNAVAQRMRFRRDRSNVEVIWDGVDCARFGPPVNGLFFRNYWEVAPNEVVVGVVGRISHWKGQELFLQAASRVAARISRIRFAIVGDPVQGDEPRAAALRLQARRLGLEEKVIFMPFDDRMPQIMRALDILVIPSTLPEPLGLVALEAMASERPVIASAHGGSLETVIPGETGLHFPPGDSSTLADAIISLASDPARRWEMGRKGRQRVLQYFSLERFSQRFTRLYTDLTS